jgi:hypothetical protein
MMDAVEFLDKVDRLSKRGSTEEKMRYTDYRAAGDNVGAVKFVERWAVAHPIKTRQSEFLKQWPDASIDDLGVLKVCPSPISTSHRNAHGGCTYSGGNCSGCRREFWLAEVEDV